VAAALETFAMSDEGFSYTGSGGTWSNLER
jgi:hypothetical protein